MYSNLTDSSHRIMQPDDVSIELMEHQKTALYAMLKYEKEGKLEIKNNTHYNENMIFTVDTNMGILSDKVGSGKTLMIVSLISLNKTPIVDRNTYRYATPFVCVREKYTKDIINSNLIIVPQKLVPQWYKAFSASKSLRVVSIATNNDIKNLLKSKLSKFDAILVSDTKIKGFMKEFGTIRWSRVIIDEADTIKIGKELEIDCSFLWLITATPKALKYNRKPFIKNIISKQISWLMKELMIKNDNNFVNQSIILPKPNRFSIQCLAPKELQIIKTFIPNNIIEMINAGNLDEAIKSLNCKTHTDDNIIKVITKNIERAIDNNTIEMESEKKKNYTGSSKESQNYRLKHLEKKINGLKMRLESIKEKIYSINDELCPICMDDFNVPTMTKCCSNVFCFECITLSTGTNPKCPYCRKTTKQIDFVVIDDGKKKNEDIKIDENKDDIWPKEKLNVLMYILKTRKNGKFLIFANYAATFSKICNEVEKTGHTYRILKGRAKEVEKTIDEFQSGKINVLMLNTKFYGAGMNLPMATDIIIYHKFTKEMEEQIVGRAQRLGRTSKLNVFYLLHDNEYNEQELNEEGEENHYDDWLEEEDNLEINNNDTRYNKMIQLKENFSEDVLEYNIKGDIETKLFMDINFSSLEVFFSSSLHSKLEKSS